MPLPTGAAVHSAAGYRALDSTARGDADVYVEEQAATAPEYAAAPLTTAPVDDLPSGRGRAATQWTPSEGGVQRRRSVYSGFEPEDEVKTSEA